MTIQLIVVLDIFIHVLAAAVIVDDVDRSEVVVIKLCRLVEIISIELEWGFREFSSLFGLLPSLYLISDLSLFLQDLLVDVHLYQLK